jgi:hypothetical protein
MTTPCTAEQTAQVREICRSGASQLDLHQS